MDLKEKIRVIPDFPQPGISFKDITTLLRDGEALREAVQRMARHYAGAGIDMVVGVESRGFILGAPLAYEMGLGFTLIRKPGKLPGDVLSVEYDLEYGTDRLEIHADSFPPGTRVLIVDDLLATGGTIAAAMELVNKLGGQVVGLAFLIELSYLGGRKKLEELGDYDILALVDYKE
ncbi:MAG: adenine phosphoribosyltransferase [Firmicutes bacterium]|nr:adenine phosphoribosyltransferase [Bacillota bacterium]